jgi:thiol-disulfide isomerase/thioredoxin
MNRRTLGRALILILAFASLALAGCGSSRSLPGFKSPLNQAGLAETPDWFDVELTDVRTGKTFTMNDFSRKVVLVETMAMWCPNCLFQAHQVREMHKLLDNPDEVISVSLDVDLHEDASDLHDYTQEFGFEWRFAVAPLQVARALGNLYSAQYLNPPLSPMLIIDREGGVHQLGYGEKSAEVLLANVQPFLAR